MNRSSSAVYANAPKFLYALGGKRYQVYDREVHGEFEKAHAQRGSSERLHKDEDAFGTLEKLLQTLKLEFEELSLRIVKCNELLKYSMDQKEQNEVKLARNAYSARMVRRLEECKPLLKRFPDYRVYLTAKMADLEQERQALSGMIRIEKLLTPGGDKTRELEDSITRTDEKIQEMRAKLDKVHELSNALLGPTIVNSIPEETLRRLRDFLKEVDGLGKTSG